MQETDSNINREAETTREKPMLTVAEQIAHMKAKGIKFDLCSEEEAHEFLSRERNLYDVASYRKLFPKHVGGRLDGRYVNLDFADLVAFASLDRKLRHAMLPITLDIERLAKVRLLSTLSEKEDEDGYTVVADYIESKSPEQRHRIRDELGIMSSDPYRGAMVRKYMDRMPAWVFVEIVSFGRFADLYLFCSQRWDSSQMRTEHYLLKSSKSLRNACAHGSNLLCVLNSRDDSLTAPTAVANALKSIGIGRSQRRNKMRCVSLNQITQTLYLYAAFATDASDMKHAKAVLSGIAEDMGSLANRCKACDSAISSSEYIESIVDGWLGTCDNPCACKNA